MGMNVGRAIFILNLLSIFSSGWVRSRFCLVKILWFVPQWVLVVEVSQPNILGGHGGRVYYWVGCHEGGYMVEGIVIFTVVVDVKDLDLAIGAG